MGRQPKYSIFIYLSLLAKRLLQPFIKKKKKKKLVSPNNTK
jgi:hypothetical protein